eukprot:TRINITY_DN5642_c0_g4_i4.p1 TRINITY_DN5642_c0_g4~~TRINITY_DN5642_c0_g4_i4.p1  ORF type:complete len:204 (-),score=53.16 TRINITY_DN5642_c0_g4_i4:74-685(-)
MVSSRLLTQAHYKLDLAAEHREKMLRRQRSSEFLRLEKAKLQTMVASLMPKQAVYQFQPTCALPSKVCLVAQPVNGQNIQQAERTTDEKVTELEAVLTIQSKPSCCDAATNTEVESTADTVRDAMKARIAHLEFQVREAHAEKAQLSIEALKGREARAAQATAFEFERQRWRKTIQSLEQSQLKEQSRCAELQLEIASLRSTS